MFDRSLTRDLFNLVGEMVRFQHERITKLETELLRMKREGFVWSEPAAAYTGSSEPLPRELRIAIQKRAATAEEEAQMRAWALQRLDFGEPEENVTDMILNGADLA